MADGCFCTFQHPPRAEARSFIASARSRRAKGGPAGPSQAIGYAASGPAAQSLGIGASELLGRAGKTRKRSFP